MEKLSTKISTLIFRIFSGILGAFILYLIYPAIINNPSWTTISSTLLIVILFFGYALGFGDKMGNFIKKEDTDE